MFESELHIGRAKMFLRVAEVLLNQGFPSDSVSRPYYAVFHAATAALKELGVQRKSHHAVWAAFGQFIASKGLMNPDFHRQALDVFSARSDSDYMAQPEDTAESARECLNIATEFVAACEAFLRSPRNEETHLGDASHP